MASLSELGEISKWSPQRGESKDDFSARRRRNNAALIGAGVGTLVLPVLGTGMGALAGYEGSKRRTRKLAEEQRHWGDQGRSGQRR